VPTAGIVPTDFSHLPFTPFPGKKVPCPMCGKVGDATSQRNPEGELIFKCKYCKIFYSQHLKKGFCQFGVNEKNGRRLQRKADGEEILVRTVLPSECKVCTVHPDKQIPCPYFAGIIGRELLPPEGWEKA
jgi:hypothetical protein